MTGRKRGRAKGEAKSIGLLGNAAEILPELVQRAYLPDVVTEPNQRRTIRVTGYIRRPG